MNPMLVIAHTVTSARAEYELLASAKRCIFLVYIRMAQAIQLAKAKIEEGAFLFLKIRSHNTSYF